MIDDEIEQIQTVYNTLTEFLVKYSFQIIGAIIILLVGILIANRLAKAVANLCLRRNLDITLSHFLASCTKIAVIIAVGVMALSKLGISITPLVAAIGA